MAGMPTPYEFTDLRIPLRVTRAYLRELAADLSMSVDELLARLRSEARVEVVD
jgi:hypothetical protein